VWVELEDVLFGVREEQLSIDNVLLDLDWQCASRLTMARGAGYRE
jgi:hypothetical protein